MARKPANIAIQEDANKEYFYFLNSINYFADSNS
jgi:hypothetical protein